MTPSPARDRFDESRRIPGRARTEIDGISLDNVNRFCDAIEFAAMRDDPTAGELDELRSVLRAIARVAHAEHQQAEHGLLSLRKAWACVCQVGRPPDMHDPSWHVIVREWLGAFELERASASA
jgi:hypothetical protein